MIFPGLLSVEIGNSTIKVLEVKKMPSGFSLRKSLLFPTPPNLVQDGRILEVEKLAGELGKRLREAGIKTTEMVATVSGTSIITREVLLPKAARHELAKMIEMNSQEYFPVNIGSYVLDYKVLGEVKQESGIQYRIMLVAVPDQLIMEYVKLASLCGLKMNSVDFAGNSVYKLIRRELMLCKKKKITDRKTAMSIDIGKDTTMITIVSDGILEFNRILLYGGSRIDSAISARLGIEDDTAEQLKISRGKILEADQNVYEDLDEAVKISDGIKSVLINYIEDIGRFIEYYNSRKTGNSIDIIYTMGAGCRIDGLEDYFEKAFGVKTERFPGLGCIFGHKVQELPDNGFSMEICAGALLNK